MIRTLAGWRLPSATLSAAPLLLLAAPTQVRWRNAESVWAGSFSAKTESSCSTTMLRRSCRRTCRLPSRSVRQTLHLLSVAAHALPGMRGDTKLSMRVSERDGRASGVL
jgi:hypothetical protein